MGHSPRHRVENAIREAVTAAGEPDGHELLIALALSYARAKRLPSGGRALRLFVDGPVHAAADSLLGRREAQLVRSRLARVLAGEMAESDAGPVSSAPRPRRTGSPLEHASDRSPTVPIKKPFEVFERETVPAPSPDAARRKVG